MFDQYLSLLWTKLEQLIQQFVIFILCVFIILWINDCLIKNDLQFETMQRWKANFITELAITYAKIELYALMAIKMCVVN